MDDGVLVAQDEFVIAGDDDLHTGPPLVIDGTGATWTSVSEAPIAGLPSVINVALDQGGWEVVLSTYGLSQPLAGQGCIRMLTE